ncbi:MAG: class I SAM-dependent methyltransferase, partial [Bacteriovoracales bacterium]|nr:class I SAM-dependent methyltransferase [Bacteriovoracales bacterium]
MMKIKFKCSICNERAFSVVSTRGYEFTIEKVVRCSNCGLIQLFPSEVEEDAQYYASGRFNHEFRKFSTPTERDIEIYTKDAQKRLGVMRAVLGDEVSNKRFLEIGCGFGSLINLMISEFGSICVGIDPSHGLASFGNKLYGLNCLEEGHYEDKKFSNLGTFDFILFYQVIEHIQNLELFFTRLERNSKPNTRLVVEFPDIGAALDRRPFLRSTYFQK